MKKFFFLFPALMLSLVLNAAVINITPTSPYDAHDNLRLALYYANSGDEIVLADGTYLEKDNYLYFDKDITVRAAEGASPIIDMYTYAQIKENANVRIEGLKFNGAAQGTYDYYFRFYDNSNTSLVLEGCEFYSVKNYVLYGNSSSHTNSLIVNNCYFHNNVKNAIYFEASGTEGVQTCDRLEVRNSTIANTAALTNYTSTIDIRPYGSDVTDAIKVIIDHCTFYNNPTINSDHSAIRPYKLSDVTISNCIFAHPEAYERRATCCYGGSISNCLTFNLTTDASQNAHRQSGGLPAFSGNFTADPLFADAANGNFHLANNWVTMSLSPALGAATDGSDLGDPRWYSAEVLPETDFASPYVLTGDKAKLTGNVATDASNYLLFSNSSDATQHGVAIWKMHATRSCILQATLNIDADNGSGHRYQIEVFDSSNTLIGTAIGESANSWDKGDKAISDLIMLSEAGDYKIKLSNLCDNSSNLLHSITLSYLGGAVIPVSPSVNTTLDIADAVFSGCTRDAGFIQFPSSNTSDAWIKWNIATSATAFYDLTLNIDAPNAHGLTVEIFENESAPAIASVTEGSYISTTGVLALELGRVNLAGDKKYIVKVTNAPSGSVAKIASLVFAPVVSTSTTLPTTLDNNDAILSEKAHITDGKLYFAPIGDTNPVGQWATWAVTADHDGTYLFALNASSDNGQSYKISILDAGNNVIDFCENNLGSGEKTLKHYFSLEAGDYSIKVENTTAWSHGYVESLVVTEPALTAINQTETETRETASAQDIQIIRTFIGGMYNTICLPFGLGSTKLKSTFGEDVELKVFAGADFDATTSVLDLNFNDATSSGIYQGTPYLIKPSHDIKNPVFEGVEISVTAASSTSGDFANFVGTLTSTEISAGEDNLFLGPNNLLYFSPDAATPVKGFRAWFVVHDIPNPAHAIKRARIVQGEQILTAIDLVNGENNNSRKIIENGQLIIIRDGVRYNVMGVKVE